MKHLSALLMLGLLVAAQPAMADTIKIPLHLPDIHVSELRGNAAVISVRIVDDRPVPGLGRELHGAAVLLQQQDAVQAIRSALENTLRDAGFSIAPLPTDNSVDLTLHLTSLSYKAVDGFLSSKAVLSCSMDAIARKQGKWRVERTMKSSEEHTVALSPDKEKIGTFVNSIVADTMQALLQDKHLINALKGHPDLQSGMID